MNSKAIKRQLLAAIAMVLVAAIALGSSTYAWFINNNRVTAEMTNISATSATPSLFIKTGTDAGNDYLTLDTAAATNALYPSSTKDLKDWYVVSNWEGTASGTVATAYTKLGDGQTFAADTGNYKIANKDFYAYNVATYTLYTTNGNQDVYFNGVDAIKVEVNDSAVVVGTAEGATSNAENVKNALRVGIMVNDVMKVIYAPVAESGTGNSKNSAADTYYAITGTATNGLTALTAKTDIFAASLTDCSYVAAAGADGLSFTAGDAELLTADESGVQVKVFVWLEGTDAQCKVGMADGVTNAVTVTVDFAGVPAAASGA